MMADRTSRTIFRKQLLTAFLAALGLFAANAPAARGQQPPELNMLVVGDSHIAGQGLKPENKFYFLVKQWLESEAFGAPRKVNLKVKAHGGSRLNLHADELAKMLKAGDDPNKYLYAEANISQPSIRRQIDDARGEYASGDEVDLVMLSGCITDVLVGNIISPFVPQSTVVNDTRRYCGDAMRETLEHLTVTFPRAQIVVLSYFPIVSKKTLLKSLPPYFLRIISFPPQLKCIFTNPLSRQLIIKPLRNKIAKRSDVWMRESEKALAGAVDSVNARLDRPRVIFVPSPIAPERSYGTKDPLLWVMGRKNRPNDETYVERKAGCAETFSKLGFQHYGRFSTRMCELSSIAHPNVEGSRIFAEAIKVKLKSVLIEK